MIGKLLDAMAKMGIWMRLNDPRQEPPSEAGREWGPKQGDFAISIQAVSPDTLSVLMKNLGTSDKVARIPGWLSYYQTAITGPSGAPAEWKRYGREVLADPANTREVERIFPAGKVVATEIPIGALYDLREPGKYRVKVSAEAPGGGGVVASNEVVVER